MAHIRFSHPEPAGDPILVHPVFLPFQGCPGIRGRCIFCAQTVQTGRAVSPVADALSRARKELEEALSAGAPARELAFYGGTFTSLPWREQAACLDLAREYRERGLVARVRASTRPDAADAADLAALRDAGLDMLELGAQSFDGAVLARARRGYDGETVRAGCRAVLDAGLILGVQLMPGLPGMDGGTFLRDVDAALSLRPATLRLYPCLVLEGTELARMWRAGAFVPWSLEETLPLLARALAAAWAAKVRVIRMGLAPEPDLVRGGILAGPHHPALGARARGMALYLLIRERLGQGAPGGGFALSLPRRLQGEFWGHGGELKRAYADLGLIPGGVRWGDGPGIKIEIPDTGPE